MRLAIVWIVEVMAILRLIVLILIIETLLRRVANWWLKLLIHLVSSKIVGLILLTLWHRLKGIRSILMHYSVRKLVLVVQITKMRILCLTFS